MTVAEFEELAAAYVLGALDDVTRKACDAHLRQHEASRRLVDELSATVDRLADVVGVVPPPPSLWTRIDGALPVARRHSWVPAVVGVAAVVALVWLGWSRRELMAQLDRQESAHQQTLAGQRAVEAQCRTDLSRLKEDLALRDRAVALLSSPTARLLPLARQPSAPGSVSATAVIDGDSGVVVVKAPPVAGKEYELWVVRGDEKKPAGLLRTVPGQPLLAAIAPGLLAGADALAVTSEPTGGSKSPTGAILLVAAVPKS